MRLAHTIDQEMAAVHGTPFTIPPGNSNQYTDRMNVNWEFFYSRHVEICVVNLVKYG
jgi:hypothetical protein